MKTHYGSKAVCKVVYNIVVNPFQPKGSRAVQGVRAEDEIFVFAGKLQYAILHSCVAIANRSSYHDMSKTLDYL